MAIFNKNTLQQVSCFDNEIIAGEYNHTGKAIIYGDTDSCYFSAYKTLKVYIYIK